MIVLLNCSTSWSKSKQDTIPSTGELVANDSVMISFDDLRRANAKLIELKYEKEINDSLKSIIVNDNNIILGYTREVKRLDKEVKQVTKQRNTITYCGLGVIVLFITSLFIK